VLSVGDLVHGTAVFVLAILPQWVAVQTSVAAPWTISVSPTGDQIVSEPRMPDQPAVPTPSTDRFPPGLTGPTWEWRRTERGDEALVIARDPKRYTVTFVADGQLSIRADCNQVVGTYVREGSSLRVELGAMTLAACEPDSQDTVFLRDLGEVAAHQIYGQDLVLELRSSTGHMIFTRQRPLPLVGTTWQLRSFNNGREALVSVSGDGDITAIFGADGRVEGFAGCNSYRGEYAVGDEAITIGHLATTRRACEASLLEQELDYLTALRRAVSYTIDGEQLRLRDADGRLQAELVAETAPESDASRQPDQPTPPRRS
jgi:heat shock protein HslJ